MLGKFDARHSGVYFRVQKPIGRGPRQGRYHVAQGQVALGTRRLGQGAAQEGSVVKQERTHHREGIGAKALRS